MLRLILAWFSSNQVPGHPLAFEPGSSWFSEALLPSPFRSRYRGDKRAEARTHADGVIGHISVGADAKSDTALVPGAAQLVITEAKMFSALSAGTRNAPSYDQAARNVACVAEMLSRAAIPPSQLGALGFYVLAPESQIRDLDLSSKVDKPSIERAVLTRAEPYGEELQAWISKWFSPTLAAIHTAVLSWEQLIQDVRAYDERTGVSFDSFYARCLAHNKPRSSEVPA